MKQETALFVGNKFDVGRTEIDRRGNDLKVVFPGLQNDILKINLVQKKIVCRVCPRVGLDAQTRRGVALWIKIHNQHTAPGFGQRCTKVYGCCRLAHAALLVGYSDDFRCFRPGRIRHGQLLQCSILRGHLRSYS